MRISDWSSDVCSSDLLRRVGVDARQLLDRKQRLAGPLVIVRVERVALDRAQPRPQGGTGRELPDVSDRLGQRLLHQVVGFRLAARQDRKSVVWGKGVSVRLDLGGGRISKNKNT